MKGKKMGGGGKSKGGLHSGSNDMGADFGRGTKKMKGEHYTEYLEGEAPDISGQGPGEHEIEDKTS